MTGLELADGIDAREVTAAALRRGLVVNAPNPDTIRLLPALTIAADDLGEGILRLRAALSDAGATI
jgi:acetylornithine/succinyldiaminopimelate/putrescine aminotransferase